jgi:hypothetical protein
VEVLNCVMLLSCVVAIPFRAQLLILTALSLNSSCFATTIVAVMARTHLFIGADSMLVRLDGNGKRQVHSICKIHVVGSCYYATSGVTLPSMKFDFTTLAGKACRSPGTLIQKASLYQKMALPIVRRMFSHDKEVPLLRGKYISVLFGAIENGYPTLIYVDYRQDRQRRIVPSRQDLRGSDLIGNMGAMISVGINETIEKYSSENPSTFLAGDAAAKVVYLLNLEFANEQNKALDQRFMGPPFSIVELSGMGVRWLSKGMCVT